MDRPLFDYQSPLAGVLAQAHERLRSEIRGERESYVRDADAEQWAAHLAEKYAAVPPVVIEQDIRINDLGEREVDASGMSGVSFSASEWGGPILRPGRDVQLVIPVEGEALLLRHGPSGGAAVVEDATVEGRAVYRRWLWPLVRGSAALDADIQQVIARVHDGATRIAAEVERHNAGLPDIAMKAIEERRTELAGHSDFLSGLTVPVARREDAPKPFSLPAIERRPRSPLTPKPEPVTGPALSAFYDEILDVVRSMGRAMERTPADFADREEEHLRDHLLVVLNAHYRGQAGAESFNRSGKTDLLLRVQDHNAVIAECKWWSGVKDLGRALRQLYGYSTWRDSRLALIVFVRAKDPAAIVEKARDAIVQRDEFDGWEPNGHATELRFRLRWPDDPGRTATLTVLFFHLPPVG